MQVSVEAGEGLERRMKIDLPFEQVTVEVDKRLQQLARTVRLPGFRPGKVPMKLLRQRFAERVHQEVFGELVQSSYENALIQASLHPAGLPRIEPDIDLKEQRLSYTAIFEIMPEFELAELSDKRLIRPVCTLTDADLEVMIERLRDQRKTWTPVERPCQNGDQVTISFIGTLDGEVFDGSSRTDFTIELGASQMIPGFGEGLIGASVGDRRTLDLAFPEHYHNAALAGKPVRFDITLDAVAEPVLPPVDADFAQAFGIEDGDLERFLADVRANMERELSERLHSRIKEQVMDLLLEAHPLDLPSTLVHGEMNAMAEKTKQSFKGGSKLDLPASLFESGARRRVALGLILGKIANENNLEADAERVRTMIDRLASTYDRPASVVEYYYSDRKRLSAVETVVLEDQIVELVMERIAVEDEAMTFAELTSAASEF